MSTSNLEAKRHSLSHLLAAAVLEMWPQAKPTLGPPVDNGFYYDFEFPTVVSESDLPKIQNKMEEIIKTWNTFARFELSPQEAKAEFKNNEYKHELINGIATEGAPITIYQSGQFRDLCRGGHVEKMKDIKADSWKLERIAGAYWRGDENNKMLTRIYGLAFDTKKELDEYLKMIEEAKKRDHRKLGKELDLFVFSELVGKGLPLWTEKGSIIRRELERFIVDEEIRRGYHHIYTPDIAKLDLYKTSGHYPYYKDSMYAPIKIDEDEFMLRPMSCPHHFELYKSQPRSYRQLPMRIAELAKLYRYEQSGELSGLLRVRSFCLADAHIVARSDQAEAEINGALDLIEYIAGILGFKANKDYRYRLSLGDRTDDQKYYKDDAAWEHAEGVLRNVLKNRAVENYEAAGEAAFYGPKIDIQIKNVLGKEDTAFTVQYDFVMPKRFKLAFTASDGREEEPIVIHRSSVGAIERTIAFLIERCGGAFPAWLAPVQIKLLPVGSTHHDYCQKLKTEFLDHGFRVELDDANETIGNKIRKAEGEKIPYSLVIGDKEIASNNLAVRKRGQKEISSLPKEKFMAELKQEIEYKK
jgi:threonyl-tRNA synthetase